MTGRVGVWITPTSPGGRTLKWDLYDRGNLTGGVGGWEVLDRPRQRDAVEWVKQPAHRQVFTLIVNGVDTGRRSIEAEAALLRSYGKPPGDGSAPPLLQLSGPIEQPAPWTLWAVEENGIEVSDAVELVRNSAGQLVQVAYTVRLIEWTGATILLGPAAAARARAGK